MLLSSSCGVRGDAEVSRPLETKREANTELGRGGQDQAGPYTALLYALLGEQPHVRGQVPDET